MRCYVLVVFPRQGRSTITSSITSGHDSTVLHPGLKRNAPSSNGGGVRVIHGPVYATRRWYHRLSAQIGRLAGRAELPCVRTAAQRANARGTQLSGGCSLPALPGECRSLRAPGATGRRAAVQGAPRRQAPPRGCSPTVEAP